MVLTDTDLELHALTDAQHTAHAREIQSKDK